MAAIVAVSVALAGVEAANAVNALKTSETGNHSSVATAQEWRTFEATAYVAFCDTGCIGVTYTGIDVSHTIMHEGRRIIAVDPSIIPLGTALTIRLADGTEIDAIAADTGGRIKGRKVDVLMANLHDAKQFGRQPVEVRINE